MPDTDTYLFVTDASVFIDAFNVGLFPKFFELGEIITTDLVLHECRRDEVCRLTLVEQIKLKQLKIESLSATDMQLVIVDRLKTKGLSIPDCSVLHLASLKTGVLLTSDARLKIVAKERGLKAHGLIYCLERLIELSVIDPPFASNCLQRWKATNDFAPRSLISEYAKKWGGGL